MMRTERLGHKNIFKTAGSAGCGLPQGDYTREPPTPRPGVKQNVANEMSARMRERSEQWRKGSKPDGRDN